MQYPLPSAGPRVSGTQPVGTGSSTQPTGAPMGTSSTLLGTSTGTTIPAAPPPLSSNPSPTTVTQQGQPPATPPEEEEEVIDRGRPFRGWYPRWWLLSALFCALLIGVVQSLQVYLCHDTLASSNFCQFSSWTDWRQALVIGVLWLLFLLMWLPGYLFGTGPIEIDQAHDFISGAVRSISQFRSVYALLLIYALISFIALILMWRFQSVPSLAFVLCSIGLFVTNCHFFYRKSPGEQRRYLLGYAFLGIVCALGMILIGPFQWVIFGSEVVIAVVCPLLALASRLLRSSEEEIIQNLPPDQQLVMKNAQAKEPGMLLQGLVRPFFHRNTNKQRP